MLPTADLHPFLQQKILWWHSCELLKDGSGWEAICGDIGRMTAQLLPIKSKLNISV